MPADDTDPLASLRAVLEEIIPRDPKCAISFSQVRKVVRSRLACALEDVAPGTPVHGMISACGFQIISKRGDDQVAKPAIRRKQAPTYRTRKSSSTGATDSTSTESNISPVSPGSTQSHCEGKRLPSSTAPATSAGIELTVWRDPSVEGGSLDATRSGTPSVSGHATKPSFPGYALLGTTAEIVVRTTGRVVGLGGGHVLIRPRFTKDHGSSRIHGAGRLTGEKITKVFEESGGKPTQLDHLAPLDPHRSALKRTIVSACNIFSFVK